MAVTLAGGCRVSAMREGVPAENGTLRIWPQIGRATGARAISLRVLEFAPGVSPALGNEGCDEILYVLESMDPPDLESGPKEDSRPGPKPPVAAISIAGRPFAVAPQTGIYLRPGQTLTVENPGPAPLVLISSQCPDPAGLGRARGSSPEVSDFPQPNAAVALVSGPLSAALPALPLVSLADRPALPTADRWYRVLVDDEVGSTQVTQFVGSIPPGRAPDHFHQYEEVLFILRGEGRMWAGETNTPLAAGSCVYLPRGQVHCVENTGSGELRLLGVFYPAGSPSVRYDV